MAKSAVIAPLTGVRLVAATWVVLFHVYLYNGDRLAVNHPFVDAVVGPIASQGDLGVDLFFLLSGFVLAHNYLDRLGPRPSLDDAASFLWLRIARVWPLYMVAILGGGLLLALRHHWWGSDPNVPLTWGRFVAQALMVQQWTAPNVPDTSWTGPAWSISAEWLAYVCFPVLALVVWRLRGRAGRQATLLMAGAVLAPTVVWTALAHTQAAPYMWLARLASEFACGVLLSAALRGEPVQLRRAATWLASAALVLVALWLYLAAALDRGWLGPLVVVLFPALVVGLAHGEGALHRWLGSGPMVLGGGVSFALYLVHVPLLKLFRDARDHGVVPLSADHQVYGELGVVLLSVLLALVLFRHVEEPARQWLRAASSAALRVRIPEPARIVRAPVVADHGLELQARQILC